jgi:hypothetical protein
MITIAGNKNATEKCQVANFVFIINQVKYKN